MEGFGFVPLEGDLTADQSATAAATAATAGAAPAAAATATTTASAGGAFDLVPSLQLPRAAPSAGTVSEITMKGCYVSHFGAQMSSECAPARGSNLEAQKEKIERRKQSVPLSKKKNSTQPTQQPPTTALRRPRGPRPRGHLHGPGARRRARGPLRRRRREPPAPGRGRESVRACGRGRGRGGGGAAAPAAAGDRKSVV